MSESARGATSLPARAATIATLMVVTAFGCMGPEESPTDAAQVGGRAVASAGVPAFPLRASVNGRFLEDQQAAPFPILGRTAWFVISLSVNDYASFLDDSVARGYNTIELHVLDHDPRGNNPPRNGNGDLPFLRRLDGGTWGGALTYGNVAAEAPDFTTPNETYWSYVDAFLTACESRGMLVLLFPAYVGYGGGNQGWMQEMTANGAARMRQYGAFLAARYQGRRNLVWMMGGDQGTFTSSQSAAEGGLITGLKSVSGQASTLFSAEWDSNSICTDQATYGGNCSLQGAYTWTGQVATYTRNAYSRTPILPAFLLEEPYDQEGSDGNGANPNATQPVRRFQYWGWLSGIGGYVSGNGYVWPFTAGWKNHLDTQGSRDMARLNGLVRSLPWQALVPSGLGGMRTLVTSGGGSSAGSDFVAAAATADGTVLVAYVPPTGTIPRSFTVDMGALAGAGRARWWNPTTAAYTDIGSSLPNSGSRTFTTPGDNGTAQNDWVLVLDSAASVSTPLSISPPSASVATGSGIAFTASGGSGVGYAFALVTSGSGGAITVAGAYNAGKTSPATDVVRVTDSLGNMANSTVTVTGGAEAAYHVDCGGTSVGTFTQDAYYSGGSAYSTSSAITTAGVANAGPAAVYQSERFGNYAYTFGGLTPGGSYVVRLHFAELYWTSAGARLFDVSVNGSRVLSSFDIFAAAGGAMRAVVRDFSAVASASGTIGVGFATVKDNAKSSGIEILPSGSVTSGPNGAPTIVSPATATPNPVKGTYMTTLTVLGADDGGEANLGYTWSTVGTQPGTVTWSTNTTNAAKTTIARFSRRGTYTLRVTIKDQAGATATSSVTVAVQR
jgi:hypothetical protein